MRTTILKGEITPTRQLMVDIPADLAPGVVDVILLYNAPTKAAKAIQRKAIHPAFGLWAKRVDLIDSGDHATQLRQMIDRHADRRA
jgi:hypothetical protein